MTNSLQPPAEPAPALLLKQAATKPLRGSEELRGGRIDQQGFLKNGQGHGPLLLLLQGFDLAQALFDGAASLPIREGRRDLRKTRGESRISIQFRRLIPHAGLDRQVRDLGFRKLPGQNFQCSQGLVNKTVAQERANDTALGFHLRRSLRRRLLDLNPVEPLVDNREAGAFGAQRRQPLNRSVKELEQ